MKDFTPLSNFKSSYIDSSEKVSESNIKAIALDYFKAYKGFTIPSIRQTEDGYFHFEFDVKYNKSQSSKLYYKIFYQNESYKFPEADPKDSTKENPFASENFYGSWDDSLTGFKPVAENTTDGSYHLVKDKFRIIGNPRWEKQLYRERFYDRVKRNPRVGNYSFLLVVLPEEELKKVPQHFQKLHLKKNDSFSNPYFYFLNGDGSKLKNAVVLKSKELLKVIAKPDLGNGVYVDIDSMEYRRPEYGAVFRKAICGRDSITYWNAPMKQYFHYVNKDFQLRNIPVMADVIGDNYSLREYNWNKKFYSEEELILPPLPDERLPCETVESDKQNHLVRIKNPKSKLNDDLRKENVGVSHRYGMTYGKFRVKAKMPELLNKNGLWNGITNAIWLVTESGEKWNECRTCNKTGYMATYWGGPNDKRVPKMTYSEIDFEILKTPPYCPSFGFPPIYKKGIANTYNQNAWNLPMPDEITKDKDDITVSCTNWDMACPQPKKFGIGCQPIIYKKENFSTEAFRWNWDFRALTSKILEKDDELFAGKFYYFEIEWKPTEIIWRIGKDKQHMRVVGYMDSSITSIPNNQMILNITQEFHVTRWWPGTPFSQENIPFPSKDIIGEIYEMEIE